MIVCVCVLGCLWMCVHCAFNTFVLTLLRMPVSFSSFAGNAVDAAESNQCVRKQLEQTSLLISRHWKMCKASHQEAVVSAELFYSKHDAAVWLMSNMLIQMQLSLLFLCSISSAHSVWSPYTPCILFSFKRRSYIHWFPWRISSDSVKEPRLTASASC